MQAREDNRLVKRVLAKEAAAFNEFFDTYFPRLYRFCLARLGDNGAVEDIVQETLIKGIRNLHTYRGEALLFTWLCRICRNEISNWYTKHGRRQAPEVSLDDDPRILASLESFGLEVQENMANQVAVAELVRLTLDYLPDKYGNVLELKYLEGLSVVEIAKRLGVGRLAVQSTLARARKAFRQGFLDLQNELEAPS